MVGQRHLLGEPVGRDRALALEIEVEADRKLGMRRRRDLAVIGDLAHLPQPLDIGAGSSQRTHLVVARGMFKHEDVLGDRRARQRVLGRRRRQRRLQCADRGEVEIGIAPLHDLHRLEGVRLQRLREFGRERRTAPGGTEGAVAHGAAGTAGDLRQLRGAQCAELIAVELAVGRERDVIDVEIEPHADGIGRHQVIDLAGLVERDLCIARTRRQRAEHDRRAAALAANEFGDGVNFLGRERDDGRAARQPRQLLLTGKGQLRQPRAADDAHPR